ncbi:hypothetical protein FB451DRAFT_1170939 [Mycena latifolia]|nr:hypothetical protein FB451DRAFT_1170939 [Mycena latifolia]
MYWLFAQSSIAGETAFRVPKQTTYGTLRRFMKTSGLRKPRHESDEREGELSKSFVAKRSIPPIVTSAERDKVMLFDFDGTASPVVMLSDSHSSLSAADGFPLCRREIMKFMNPITSHLPPKAPRTTPASGLKPLVLVGRLEAHQAAKPAKKRSNLLRVLKKKKTKTKADSTGFVFVNPAPAPGIPASPKPPFVVPLRHSSDIFPPVVHTTVSAPVPRAIVGPLPRALPPPLSRQRVPVFTQREMRPVKSVSAPRSLPSAASALRNPLVIGPGPARSFTAAGFKQLYLNDRVVIPPAAASPPVDGYSTAGDTSTSSSHTRCARSYHVGKLKSCKGLQDPKISRSSGQFLKLLCLQLILCPLRVSDVLADSSLFGPATVSDYGSPNSAASPSTSLEACHIPLPSASSVSLAQSSSSAVTEATPQKICVEIAIQTDPQEQALTEQQAPMKNLKNVNVATLASPKTGMKTIRSGLIAALKARQAMPATSPDVSIDKNRTTRTAFPPSTTPSPWSKTKRDTSALLDELKDRLARRKTPSLQTQMAGTSSSSAKTPTPFIALRPRRPPDKENVEPEEGELLQLFKRRRATGDIRVPFGVVDVSVEGPRPLSESGARKFRRVVVPPVVEGSVPSRDARILSELDRLRAQGKVARNAAGVVGARRSADGNSSVLCADRQRRSDSPDPPGSATDFRRTPRCTPDSTDQKTCTPECSVY